MAGTVDGGQSAASTNKQRYGEDFYKKIGRMGGEVYVKNKGFGSNLVGDDGLTGHQRAVVAGERGGRASRRTKGAY